MKKLILFIFSLQFILSGCSNAEHSHKIQWIFKPCIQPVSGYDYHICEDMKVKVDNQLITIPKGFITDLASIPRPLWPILAPQYAGFVYPAILHDFFYRCPENVTREYADDVLYYALKEEGVSTYTAMKFWLGVRTFGGEHFAEKDNCKYNYYYSAEVKNTMMVS